MWWLYIGDPPRPFGETLQGARCCDDKGIQYMAKVARTGCCRDCPYYERYPVIDCWVILRRDARFYFCGKIHPNMRLPEQGELFGGK